LAILVSDSRFLAAASPAFRAISVLRFLLSFLARALPPSDANSFTVILRFYLQVEKEQYIILTISVRCMVLSRTKENKWNK
jgi:hypothetical protein